MSFAQLHAAASVAAADAAYLEDVRTVQQLLKQLRRHASAVVALRRFYATHGPSVQQTHASLDELQLLQHQHQQQLQRELETARSSADSVHSALRQLQWHVSAADSLVEKRERQLTYTQLAAAAGQLVGQLRDAAQGEEWFLQQHQERLLLLQNEEEESREGYQTVPTPYQGALGASGIPFGVSKPSHAQGSLSKPIEPVPASVGAGSTSQAEAATPDERGWNAAVENGSNSRATRETGASRAYTQVAPPMSEPTYSEPAFGGCPAPLQLQHQLMRANASVPIFIPESRVDASLLQEKRESLAKIHREIRSIQSLYEQMAFFTAEQGDRLDDVDQSLTGARAESARAARELSAAYQEKRRRRCRRCLFGGTLFLLVLLFVFALWWNAMS
ncbi:uncharacterized protein LOC34618819 [Cyclospora cayetanensis]|uniref:Uncharacterized protein n=2 Tax=Cyclospora cayetanensis TaxID=88456 RepID=A0A1D3D0P3_9EIME|nr:uncharacterized protein LOC34618819 [Cyclospora cayetanensis]OEH77024.1 hypothetical protein cyc_01891 [Cyclospora cayetanensis]